MGQGDIEKDSPVGKVVQQAGGGSDISTAYNALPPDEKRAAFAALRNAQSTDQPGLNNLVVTGLDIDGDGKEDVLGDVYNHKTGADLYNRTGEAPNSPEARAARERALMGRAAEMDVTNPQGVDNTTVSSAREYWEKANQNADSATKAVLSAIAHDVLMPMAALDYLANVDPQLVSEGRKQAFITESGQLRSQGGVFRADTPQEVEKFRAWLDAKIPRDGQESTDDKRTALILKLALSDASLETANPHEQCTKAYFALMQMRVAMNTFAPGSNNGNASDIANAEHFLETSYRVSAPMTESNDGDAGIGHGPLSAPAWAIIAPTYGVLKKLGLFEGSKAGTQQTGWELAGIGHGLRVYVTGSEFTPAATSRSSRPSRNDIALTLPSRNDIALALPRGNDIALALPSRTDIASLWQWGNPAVQFRTSAHIVIWCQAGSGGSERSEEPFYGRCFYGATRAAPTRAA